MSCTLFEEIEDAQQDIKEREESVFRNPFEQMMDDYCDMLCCELYRSIQWPKSKIKNVEKWNITGIK